MPDLPTLYTLQEVAKAIGMSDRWVRTRIAEGAAHTRFGHKIRFTEEQYQALLRDHLVAPPQALSITTGPRRRRRN